MLLYKQQLVGSIATRIFYRYYIIKTYIFM